jgi:SAM-dependent methyltransferase
MPPRDPLGYRTETELRDHYEIERELADRLRSASRAERQTLYHSVYDELFQRVPRHPQLVRGADPAAAAAEAAQQVRMLTLFLQPGATFLEVGAGDCALSVAVAAMVARVYAVDVSDEITPGVLLPDNVELFLSDGTSIPVPKESVDLGYSNQLMEHLHPDDAYEQLRNIYESLRPGGRYVCITPNRVTGPYDISMFFDDEATGFHLKEYRLRELRKLLRHVGFSRARILVGARGRFARMPPWPAELLEMLVGPLPVRVRQTLGQRFHANAVLGIRIVAQK